MSGPFPAHSIFAGVDYLRAMPIRKFQPCIPTPAPKVPASSDWLREVKHDGFRMIVQRDGDRVRLFTRNGHDWADRYPWIVDATRRIRQKQFVIDGEAVVLGVDGISDFEALYSPAARRRGAVLRLLLAFGGDDVRELPLSMRKTNLARLLARRTDGIFIAPFEQGEIGPDLFRHACIMGLEGLVSKRRDRPYRAGRSPHWIKVKNPKSPAMTRAKDIEWPRTVKR
jgi:bifunctional non-homologous end joining protein LigD